MEWLQNLAYEANWPLAGAFALGLLTAISPCPLGANLTATAWIARGFTQKSSVAISGTTYTLGRALSYTGIAAAIYFGASKFHVARFLQSNGERWLAPLLIVVGLVMLGAIALRFPGGLNLGQVAEKWKLNGILGAFLLGALFALAFCPYSGALFFGVLIPMTIQDGLGLAVAFAIGTGLPVVVLTLLLAYSLSSVGKVFRWLQQTEKVMRWLAGGAFVLAGLYYIWIFWLAPLFAQP